MNIWPDVIKWLLLLAALLILYYIWLENAEQWEEEKEQALGGGGNTDPAPTAGEGQSSSESDDGMGQADSPESADTEGAEEAKQDPRLSRQAEQLRRLLEENPELLEDLLDAAGMSRDLTTEKLFQDPRLAEELARTIPEDAFDILDSRSPDLKVNLDIDLKSSSKLEKTSAGGIFQRSERMRRMDDVKRLDRREWAQPRGLRRQRIMQNEARVRQDYTIREEQKEFYLLEDGSGSMSRSLRNGQKRFVGSRRLVIRLAEQAVAGKVKFVYRYFHGFPGPAVPVTNKEEAVRFKLWASTTVPTGDSTNIFRAFDQVIEDIGNRTDIDEVDILLISDGEDDSMGDTQRIKTMLGDKIRLHVILIGLENRQLKQVATSYQVVG